MGSILCKMLGHIHVTQEQWLGFPQGRALMSNPLPIPACFFAPHHLWLSKGVSWYLPIMTRRPLCSLCKKHRPGSLRICVRCKMMIGPGCDPEQCLYRQYDSNSGICKECHRITRIQILTQSTPDYLRILTAAGF